MPRIVGRVTVFFNETRGSAFFKWQPDAAMVRSAYYVDHRVEVECEVGEPWRLKLAEEMYRIGNADLRINGRTERSISVGDVLEVTVKTIDGVTCGGTGAMVLSCDSFGFGYVDRAVWFAPERVAARKALIPPIPARRA